MKRIRDYKKEYRDFHGKPAQIKRRSSTNAARKKMIDLGYIRKGDPRQIDHINHNALDNRLSNLRVRSAHANQADNYHKTKPRKAK